MGFLKEKFHEKTKFFFDKFIRNENPPLETQEKDDVNNIIVDDVPEKVGSQDVVKGLVFDDIEEGPALLSFPDEIFEPPLAETVKKVLFAHFSNGFRFDSIELSRFCRFAEDSFDYVLPVDERKLERCIRSCGILFDKKVYPVSDTVKDRVWQEVHSATLSGAEVIFYEAFYEHHRKWLFEGSVISKDMLKEMLQQLFPRYIHNKNCCFSKGDGSNEISGVKGEILRIWGDRPVRSYSWLSEQLPYIPIEKIRYMLSQDSDFVSNATGEYALVNALDVNERERVAITEYVRFECENEGYVPLKDIPLGEIEERNYELSQQGIQNAVFEIVLAKKYEMRRGIITPKGEKLDVFAVMKNYCSTLERCLLWDLRDFEKELAGRSYINRAMEAANAVMVRVNKDTYVAEKYVHFDVAAIDAELDFFVLGRYLPLKSVTTFAAFPECGQRWNLFLLESYCRRFSKKFRFDALLFNTKNAGAIIRKSCKLSYTQIMVDILAKSDVPLTKKAAEAFLYSHGYIGTRSNTRVGNFIKEAKNIRERKM